MKYYEILPTHTETPRNATRKIANLYIEFNYHFLTLQKKIPLLLNRSVQIYDTLHVEIFEKSKNGCDILSICLVFKIFRNDAQEAWIHS